MNSTIAQCIKEDGLSIINPDTHFTYQAKEGDLIKKFIREYYGAPNLEVTDELIAVFAESEEFGEWKTYTETYSKGTEDVLFFEDRYDSIEERFEGLFFSAQSFYDYQN